MAAEPHARVITLRNPVQPTGLFNRIAQVTLRYPGKKEAKKLARGADQRNAGRFMLATIMAFSALPEEIVLQMDGDDCLRLMNVCDELTREYQAQCRGTSRRWIR